MINLAVWKLWFRSLRKVVNYTRKRSVINHSNFSKLHNRIFNWGLNKQKYAQAKIHDLECKCGVSEVQRLLELRKVL